jgi:hypothetical protein
MAHQPDGGIGTAELAFAYCPIYGYSSDNQHRVPALPQQLPGRRGRTAAHRNTDSLPRLGAELAAHLAAASVIKVTVTHSARD